LLSGAALGEDAFYSVRVGDLDFREGKLPVPESVAEPWRRLRAPEPYARIDGPGEAYLLFEGWGSWEVGVELGAGTLVVRAPRGQDVGGRLFAPRSDLGGLIPFTFSLPSFREDPAARAAFFRAKEAHYQRLLERGVPGAAWFRHQAEEARRALGEDNGAAVPGNAFWQRGTRPGELEDTFAIFTGGRALSENLQLDRLLAPAPDGGEEMDVASLPGITVQEMDWKPLLRDLAPEKDPLAANIPADQHAVLFRSFQDLIDLADEADRQGTPVLELIEPRAEDART